MLPSSLFAYHLLRHCSTLSSFKAKVRKPSSSHRISHRKSRNKHSIRKPYYNCYRDVRQTVSPPLTTNHNICSNDSARKASNTVCRHFCV